MKTYSARCRSMTCNLIFLAAHHHPDRKTSIVNVNVVKWFGFPRFLAMKFFLIIGSDRKACGSILRGTIEEKQRDTKSYREFFWHNGST